MISFHDVTDNWCKCWNCKRVNKELIKYKNKNTYLQKYKNYKFIIILEIYICIIFFVCLMVL